MSATYTGDVTPAGEDRTRVAPASFGQRRMWFLGQLDTRDSLYNSMYSESLSLRVVGPLDRRVLQRCVEQLVRRHEVLRTRLVARNGHVTQVVEPEGNASAVPVVVIDLSDGLERDRPAEAARLIDEHLSRPFDLGTELPIRVLVVAVAADEHLVFLDTHHACVDDWSLLVAEWDLVSWYAHFVEGAPAPLPPSERYTDYCAEQHERVGSEQWRRQLDYWRSQLEGAPSRLEFPVATETSTDEGRSGNDGRREVFTIPTSLMDSLSSVARARGCSLFSAALAAFGVLLWQQSGSRDVPIGVPVTERTPAEYSTVLGFFGNTVVARLRLDPGLSFAQVLDHTHQVMADASTNQAVPFETVVEELRPKRRRNEVPFFNTLFAMRLNRRTMQAGGVSFIPEADRNRGNAIVDLMIRLEQRDGQYYGLLDYRTAVFDAESARRVADDYLRLVAEFVADPDKPIDELPISELADDGISLGSPGDGRRDLDIEYRPPESDLERKLCAVWQEMLARPAIGIDDDFIELGGHSLLAAHVAIRVREQLAVTLSVSWFFETPTIRTLAIDIQRMRQNHAGTYPDITSGRS